MHLAIRQAIKTFVLGTTAACFFVAGGTFTRLASAEGLSDKPITFMVPFSPSTGLDVMARLVGEELTKRWNQPVVIKIVTGASGTIGTGQVARSEPAPKEHDPTSRFAQTIMPHVGRHEHDLHHHH